MNHKQRSTKLKPLCDVKKMLISFSIKMLSLSSKAGLDSGEIFVSKSLIYGSNKTPQHQEGAT